MFRCLPLLGKMRFPRAGNELFGGIITPVDQERADQRLHHIADNIVALVRAILARLLAKPHEGRKAKLAADIGAGLSSDQHVIAAREIAFRLATVPVIKCAAP